MRSRCKPNILRELYANTCVDEAGDAALPARAIAARNLPRDAVVAVRVRFELTEPVKVQRFSRPPHSTTLPPHRFYPTWFQWVMVAVTILYCDFLPLRKHFTTLALLSSCTTACPYCKSAACSPTGARRRRRCVLRKYTITSRPNRCGAQGAEAPSTSMEAHFPLVALGPKLVRIFTNRSHCFVR